MCFSEGTSRGQRARAESSQASDIMGKAAQGSWGGGCSLDTTDPGYVLDQSSRAPGSSIMEWPVMEMQAHRALGCRMSGV